MEMKVLKEKIEKAREKKAKAEGAIERIKEQLKKEYGVETVEQAMSKLSKLQAEVDQGEKKLDAMVKTLQGMANWDEI